jgi:hypothetical protein
MTKTTTHGGTREGAGRKPSPDKKVNISAKVTEDVRAYIRTVGSGVIESTIRSTRSFNNWLKRKK